MRKEYHNCVLIRRMLGVLVTASMAFSILPGPVLGQAPDSIRLNPPDLTRGLPFMEALSIKASAREWADRELSLQDLSDLLWAANGVNRPEERKYTASSALNAHDIDLYLFLRDGVYIYDYDNHALKKVLDGDLRTEITRSAPPRVPAGSSASQPGGTRRSDAPVQIVLVSDSSRFRAGEQAQKYEWSAIDAGIVSQNISLFCAATGLKTRPRASMDKAKVKELLGLGDASYVLLNHPVGYEKQ